MCKHKPTKENSSKCYIVIYMFMQHQNDTIIKQTQGQRRGKERSRKENAGRRLYKYIYLSLYCKISKGLLKVCMWEGAGDRT